MNERPTRARASAAAAAVSSFIFLVGVVSVNGDVYMHNPRGSNNRLNERSANRNNGNRMFDSQVCASYIHSACNRAPSFLYPSKKSLFFFLKRKREPLSFYFGVEHSWLTLHVQAWFTLSIDTSGTCSFQPHSSCPAAPMLYIRPLMICLRAFLSTSCFFFHSFFFPSSLLFLAPLSAE